MRNEVIGGVLVIGHGSRRQEANEDVREAARRIGERGEFDLVEAAFLEIEDPNISEGFARLVQRPCHLAVGKRTGAAGVQQHSGDSPSVAGAAARCACDGRTELDPLLSQPAATTVSTRKPIAESRRPIMR